MVPQRAPGQLPGRRGLTAATLSRSCPVRGAPDKAGFDLITTAMLKSGSDAQIVDVRDPAEVAEGMIPGAKHIALGELAGRLIDLDKSRPVIAVCRSGRRSTAAMDQLTAAGFTAYTMPGGMLDWSAAGFPTA